MTRPLRRLSALAVLALASLAAAGGPASARSGTAPVTAPDRVTTYPGNFEFLKVLANDSDAEGDRLRVCALGSEKYRHIRTDPEKRTVSLDVGGKAQPGTYTFTYYACDGTAQTPGTLTLVVLEPPVIKVRHVPAGLRAVSKAAFQVRLTYGNFSRDDPEGVVRIPRRGSVVFTSRYEHVDWIARTADGTFLDQGHAV
jgi:hypothetical protein